MPEKKIKVLNLPTDVEEDAIYIIDQSNPNSYTHSYFKYPCKFIPEIPRWGINKYAVNNADALILDPFAGSGTTLLEASINGINSVGTEIDEIAKLLIKVKTTKLSVEEMTTTLDFTNHIIRVVEEHNYDSNAVVLPLINNINHWFREDILQDLGHIYFKILRLENENVKDFLKICFASIIKKVSNADDISPKPYVSNKIVKIPPAVGKTFLDCVEKNLAGMKELQTCELAEVRVEGNALMIPCQDDSIDFAITSPPYINAFDYVRTLRLENLWLELETEEGLREKKKLYLGTESIKTKEECKELSVLDESELLKQYFEIIVEVDNKRALVMKKFFEDMKTNLVEIYRVLKKGSCYAIVIGNSSIRGVNIETWKILRDLAINIGFRYETHFAYEIQNPYIRIPRGNKGGKISIDHILVIRK